MTRSEDCVQRRVDVPNSSGTKSHEEDVRTTRGPKLFQDPETIVKGNRAMYEPIRDAMASQKVGHET